MNSPSHDDLFARYRAELSMDPEARARSFRKLQERLLSGEVPAPETNVPSPEMPGLRGLWSVPAKWVATIAGLGVGAAIWLNVELPRAPLTAADPQRPVAEQTTTGEPAVTAAPRVAAADAELHAPAGAQTSTLSQRAGWAAEPSSGPPARSGGRTSASGRRTSAEPSAAQARALQPPAAETPDVRVQQGPAAAALERSGTQPSAAAQLIPERSHKAIASETLTKEVELLQAAQLALRAGDTQRSLALLAEHTWAYPHGHLAEARDVARILALCQSGNVDQSKLHAKRFLQQRPESPYALRVRAGCAALTGAREPAP